MAHDIVTADTGFVSHGVFMVLVMKRTDVRSEAAAGMPTGLMPVDDAAVAPSPDVAPAVGPVLTTPAPPAGTALPVESVESVESVVCGARDVVAGASRVPLDAADSDTLAQVIAAAGRLRSATEALLLNATAALEAARAGSGRTALRDKARLSVRRAKRTVEVSEQVAQMPNVARGLALGELTAQHVEVLADAARQTSPQAVNNAAELLEAAAAVAPEVLRRDARDFAARHDPDAARTVLDRQRRDRSAAMFIDESTGMGVLNARLDPVSYALVLQAVENYNDALWRQDGGRDGTPEQIRDNRQRRADSIFEMLTNRNALATIGHPAARTGNTAHPSPGEGRPGRNGNHTEHAQSDHGRHGRNNESEPGHSGDVVPADAAGRSVERWRPSQAPNQLVIIADIGVIDGTKPDGLCEMLGGGPVPPQILNNLSPDTHITGALFAGPGQVLWLGRGGRHATVAQQLAIAIRDRGCVLCRAPMHRCKHHHIDEWAADNGTTDTDNLAALCDRCHTDLHNNNQRLEHHPATGHWDTTPRPAGGNRTDTTNKTATNKVGDTRADGTTGASPRDPPGFSRPAAAACDTTGASAGPTLSP